MVTPFADAARSGVHYLPPARRKAVLAQAERTGYGVRHAELSSCSNADALLSELGRSLELPEWYGANFDALYDCLTDLDCLPAKGFILFIDGLETLRVNKPEAFATLVEVLQSSSQAHKEGRYPFWVLLDARSRGVPTLPTE